MLDRNNFSRCIGDSLSRANVGILWEILQHLCQNKNYANRKKA